MDEILQLETNRPFPAELPLDANTRLLSSVPAALYFPAVLGLAAATGLAGATLGRAAAPLEAEQREVVAAAVGAAAAGAVLYGGVRAKKVRDRGAVVELFNVLVGMDEPADLTAGDVKAVGDKYGINMQKDQLQGLQQIFGQYLETIIPVGDTQLR